MKLLFLPNSTPIGASARARIYHYLPYLEQRGIEYTVIPGTTEEQDLRFLCSPNFVQRAFWYARKIISRLRALCGIRQADCVYILREALPYFFPFAELLLKRFAKRLIFDFDDALFFHPKKKTLLKRLAMDPRSASRIIRLADRVIVSTPILAEYAARLNDDVVVIPTCVRFADYETAAPRQAVDGVPVIGWIGNPSTQIYLFEVAECLRELAKSVSFILRVIGAQGLKIPGIRLETKNWELQTEISDICGFTIGIMPLPDDPWTRGKGGFKLIQYLAAGVPAVASRVGVNCAIIDDGVNGLLASSADEWQQKLLRLLTDAALRRQFSQKGREVAQKKFSIEANHSAWLNAVTRP